MEVVSIRPRSYCRGVVLAIKKALATKVQHPDAQVTVLGALVHNELVVKALALKGVHTVEEKGLSRQELLDLVPPGFVVFSAHGVSDEVKALAQAKGLHIVDATCPEVGTTKALVQEKLGQGYLVFYVGKAGHPEAVAVTEGHKGVYLITDIASIPDPAGLKDEKIFVTNQTTLSVTAIEQVFAQIKQRFPGAEFANEICSATRMRQEAIQAYDDLDCLLVVGDPSSNNTAMLEKIAIQHGIPLVYRIEQTKDLNLAWLEQDMKIGVTAGASTPPYLIDQVENYLKQLDLANPAPFPEIDLEHLLD